LIFATVGTHHQPFERFLHSVLALAAGMELVVQHGHTAPLPSASSVCWRQWLTPEEMDARMREAAIVITHAGVASVVDALRAGHRPVVVARRCHLGEHVDEHQLQIVTALGAMGLVVPFRADMTIETTLAPPRSASMGWPPPGLKTVVRHTVFEA
jgi:UDP-N-acetylglucosamine transferase subunit ALG13